MTAVAFVVYGHPMPKGSKTAITRGGVSRMIDAAPSRSKDPAKRKAQRERMAAWPRDVERIARFSLRVRIDAEEGAIFAAPIDGPVNVCARFYFPRPKHETKAKRVRVYHTGKPDLDKLLRGILDPMKKAGVFTDDCRVVSFQGSEKRYVPWMPPDYRPVANGMPRVEITVTRLAETE